MNSNDILDPLLYDHDSDSEESDHELDTNESELTLTEPQVILTDPTASFVAEFSDGYSFRNMIEYLRVTNTQGNFRFGRESIKYEQANASNVILNQIEIQSFELTHYEFYSRTDEIIIGVTIADMRLITKTTGKKDGIRLYKMPNDPLLYIQIISQSVRGTDRTNISVVRPCNISMPQYEFPEYKLDEKYPNCTVPTADFARMCTAMSSVKCDIVTIRGLPKGAIFEAMMPGGIVGRIERFGNCDNYTQTVVAPDQVSTTDKPNITIPTAPRPKLIIRTTIEESVIRLKTSTIKSLTKLNNLSATGTVKIYLEPRAPLKLLCKIGTYGTLKVLIRSYD